jgi:hypothetical protein
MRDNMWMYLTLLIQAGVSVQDKTAGDLVQCILLPEKRLANTLKSSTWLGQMPNQFPSTVLPD